jgi:hypothetical protein
MLDPETMMIEEYIRDQDLRIRTEIDRTHPGAANEPVLLEILG